MQENYHFIGIGGIGMSGLAKLFVNMNQKVSGSDLAKNTLTQNLENQGVKISYTHSQENIEPAMTVVYSSGIKESNPELIKAKQMQCPIFHRSDILNRLMKGYHPLLVTGTHGKTTTTALLTWVLLQAEKDPSYAIGGILKGVEANAGLGSGNYFIAEADESDGTFLRYEPYGAIVTNIGLDHLDYYLTESALIEGYRTFINKVSDQSLLFYCGDCQRLEALQPNGCSYGYGEKNRLRGSSFKQNGLSFTFDIDFEGRHYPAIHVSLPGKQNGWNAMAVFGMAIRLGIPEEKIRLAFRTFPGVHRRSEVIGEAQGVTVIHDYAHHPTEIASTLSAIREGYPDRRILVIYQPHRYSRVHHCIGLFGSIFNEADIVGVTDIYPAGESPIEGISAKIILDEITTPNEIYYFEESLNETLFPIVRPHDVVVFLGAGDIVKSGVNFFTVLIHRPITKISIALITGGKSEEHSVALRSAQNIAKGLRSDLYDISSATITRKGEWSIEDPFKMVSECDLFFPVLHGPFGEDGTIQGFFEILGKPYVGMDYRASAICMDKVLTKKLLDYHDVPTLPFISFYLHEWKKDGEKILKTVIESFDFPVFLKGAHLGSSIGVYKIQSPEAFGDGVSQASAHDCRFIVEPAITGREIEFSVIGNEEVVVFPPGEILTEGRVYDYEAKYSARSFQTTTSPALSQDLILEGMELAKQAYKAVDGNGMARIDFFLDAQNHYWCNEINPIPGFTEHSLFPKMCETGGLSVSALLDRLIILAMDRHRKNPMTRASADAST